MNSNSVNVIKPGIMVSLKSSVTGGVSYTRQSLEWYGDEPPPEVLNTATPEKAKVEKWETVKTVLDAEEHERATKVRGAALSLIRKCCAPTAFGLLCPESMEEELNKAIQEARRLADEHNSIAQHTRVYIYALKGRIASTDEEAARAIGEEVKTILDDMNRAIDKLDPKEVRKAVDRAKAMATMLQAEQAEKVSLAIEQARKAARTIQARIIKNGEEAAVVLDDIARGAIEKARIMFLDYDSSEPEISGPALPGVEVQRIADLDYEPDLDYAAGEGN